MRCERAGCGAESSTSTLMYPFVDTYALHVKQSHAFYVFNCTGILDFTRMAMNTAFTKIFVTDWAS